MVTPLGNVDVQANHDSEIYGVTITLTLLALIAVVLLFLTVFRFRNQKPVLDDYMISVALILAMVECIYVCVQTEPYGVGRHVAGLRPTQVEGLQKLVYTVSLLQPCVLALAKLAVLRLFYQIFTAHPFRLAITLMVALVLTWWFGTFFANLLICIPVRYNWNQNIRGAHCGNHRLLYIVTPIPWIVTDLMILVLPIPMVWSLQMPRKQKTAISAVFLLGGLSFVSSVVRYSYTFYNSDDITWTVAPLVIWNVLEATVTIIAACLVVMRPLYVHLFEQRLVLYRGGKKSNPSNNTDHPLIDPMGGRFMHINDGIIGASNKTNVESQRRWPGVGRQHDPAGSDPDLEAYEFQVHAIHVKNTVDVVRDLRKSAMKVSTRTK